MDVVFRKSICLRIRDLHREKRAITAAEKGNTVGETVIVRSKIPPIKLNQLVKRPAVFDGFKPPARRWLDDFEKAAEANGWSEAQMVKYFSTFLDKSANDWFVSLAIREVGSEPTWRKAHEVFVRHYLGERDRLAIRREVDRSYQREGEKANIFIPNLTRTIWLGDPQKPEEEVVDIVRSKLRPEYLDRLVLYETPDIKALNDAHRARSIR